MAIVASHRSCQGEAARWPIIAIGCGLGVRLQRSEPPHASLQPIGWHKSGRMASGARRIASRDSRRFRRLCQGQSKNGAVTATGLIGTFRTSQADAAMSPLGTERTNWAGLLMSVDWGRPVVAG